MKQHYWMPIECCDECREVYKWECWDCETSAYPYEPDGAFLVRTDDNRLVPADQDECKG